MVVCLNLPTTAICYVGQPMRPPTAPVLQLGGQLGPPMGASHTRGVGLMEAGNWDGAVKEFSKALDNAQGAACRKEAQYLAAVKLLKVGDLSCLLAPRHEV